MIEQFKKDVDAGLSAIEKSLPSQYFYDATGDRIFQEIMDMPEYYLTRAEDEIFFKKTQQLIDALNVSKSSFFEIIELGAGDGKKTKKLLKKLVKQGYDFVYHPVDISGNILEHLQQVLAKEIPELDVQPKQDLYFDALAAYNASDHKKVVLFLGSNIGNLDDKLAADFLYQMGSNFKHDDILLLGVDLKKSRDIVLPAYNDSNGITARFNLNLLTRINRELGANFILDNFSHEPEYFEEEGIAYSYLLSLTAQTVCIESLNKTYDFAEGEKIQTEISRKYDESILNNIIAETDFKLVSKIMDSNAYFADYILKRQ